MGSIPMFQYHQMQFKCRLGQYTAQLIQVSIPYSAIKSLKFECQLPFLTLSLLSKKNQKQALQVSIGHVDCRFGWRKDFWHWVMFVRKTRGKFVELKAIGGAAHRKRLMPCTQGKGMDYRQQRSVEPEIRAYRYGKGHFCIFLHRLSFCKNAENIPRAQYCNWWKAYADFASCCLGWCLHRTIFSSGAKTGKYILIIKWLQNILPPNIGLRHASGAKIPQTAL